MLNKNKLRLSAVAAIVTAGVAFSALPAMADPTAGTFAALSGVGSDTIQDVMNGMSTKVSAIASYDATGGGTIQTKAGGNAFNRPVGSGNGVAALSDSINSTGTKLWNSVDITGQIDFARSSSGPSSSFPGTVLTYIPFAQDAVTFAVNSGSDFPRDIPVGAAAQDSITPAPFTLRNIYRCVATTYTDNDSNSVTIRPLLPQTGSGTRKFWLTTLGLTEATKGSCDTDLANSVIEHDGTYVSGAGDIAPFSIAQYLAQGNHVALPTTVVERRGQAQLGFISGIKPIIPTPGTTGGTEMNPNFPVFRNVYNVVETARLTSDATLQATFSGPTSSVCTNVNTIKQYGFAPIANCGNTTIYKSGYTA
ncbi:MAG: hypothetical protein H7248_09975 [Microbacteriaceae bacterium]|nr:hypothetical protein [Microbacteriaceae bacterium]